jgi:alpha-ribazole phosphatase
MTRLLLVRHGETDWNREGRYQGQTGTPLNEAGRAQTAQLAARLAGEALDAVYSSDLKRACETAQIIAAPRGLTVARMPQLREAAFGVLEGLTYDEAKAQYPQALDAWHANPDCPPPGGEALSQVAARVQTFLDGLTVGQTALVVGHGGPLRVLLCLVMGLPAAQHWQFRLDTASFTTVNLYDAGAILSLLNDTSHLRRRGDAS